jgi:hypothetical protein
MQEEVLSSENHYSDTWNAAGETEGPRSSRDRIRTVTPLPKGPLGGLLSTRDGGWAIAAEVR